MRRWIPILLLFVCLPVAARAEGIYLGSGIGLGIPTPEIEPLGKELEHDPGFAWEAVSFGYDHKAWGLGIQWGGAGGEADSYFYGDGAWAVDYLTVSVRYLFTDGPINPYVEIGSGAYVYTMLNDFAEIESDPVPGLRLAVGTKFNLGRVYVAAELDYHAADFGDAEIETRYTHSELDLDSRVDMLFLLVKSGMQSRN